MVISGKKWPWGESVGFSEMQQQRGWGEYESMGAMCVLV